ncbi:MAG: NUDIX domain-containing protein [Armatimonadota bacterium]|nr:NUDIX domain-containing protein [Armatimonadota bacterium]MDR5697401.1 NUDIX domain-containing protein [Armatimonadota bacterium]
MTIRATLCFIVRDGQVLLLRKAEGLWGSGKWNAPGGKLADGEDPCAGAVREVREETGLTVADPQPRGTLRFYFGQRPEPAWVVYLFVARRFSGRLRPGEEGILQWHAQDALPYDQMWEDDRYWLPALLRGETVDGDFYFDEAAAKLLRHELRVDSLAGGEGCPPDAGVVHSIQVSRGGVPKHPVPCASVTFEGIEGDGHHDARHHGGRERALCLFSLEVIERLRAEGHPISPGSVGENLTVSGLDWSRVVPGTRLRVGEVEIEVTQFTTPCATIRASFREGRYERISPTLHPGDSRVYARVLQPGMVRVGDAVRILMASPAPKLP